MDCFFGADGQTSMAEARWGLIMRFISSWADLKGRREKNVYGCFPTGKFENFLDQLLENLAVTTSHHQQVKNTDD